MRAKGGTTKDWASLSKQLDGSWKVPWAATFAG